MPKERRDRSVSRDRYRSSPLCCDSNHTQRSPKPSSESKETLREWEDARCPVCMEHPHNAVLLVCSSHEKGCRPYMCDTSYRHSNCLDQFCKSSQETNSPIPQQEEETNPSAVLDLASDSLTIDLREAASEEGPSTATTARNADLSENPEKPKPKLICPLCRGEIKEWIVMEDARHFMNAKLRSCACEACNFSGTYSDLRKHARLEHPRARPSEADPERQRNWRRLERQRDLGDLLSTLQSSFGGEERGDDGILSFDDGGWLTVFFLIRVFRPGSNSPRRSSSWSGTSRARSQLGVRRRSTRLWGESYDGDSGSSSRDEENNNNQSSDDGSGSWRRRVRRRAFLDDDDEP